MMSPYFSLAAEAQAIDREIAAEPDAVVACEALPNTASSLYYYLNARVHWVNAPFNQDYAQRVMGEGRDYYWDEAGLVAQWKFAAAGVPDRRGEPAGPLAGAASARRAGGGQERDEAGAV